MRMPIKWKFYDFKKKILINLLGWKLAENGPDNIPEIGEVCWIDLCNHNEMAIFKEHPLAHRMSENEFRYYFELIDGSLINTHSGIAWKTTGRHVYKEAALS